MSQFDQEILQDFLTESGELLEQLDKDLVLLETTPRDPDLLNRIFRALHTIKGSASFLALTNLVNVAHAAEGALNAARNSQILVTREVMDLLLSAVDILKRQFEDLTAGRDLTAPNEAMVRALTLIAEGRQPVAAGTTEAPKAAPVSATPAASSPANNTSPAGSAQPSTAAAPSTATIGAAPSNAATPVLTPSASPTNGAGYSRTPLSLPENKAMLVEFLVTDLRDMLAAATSATQMLCKDPNDRGQASLKLVESSDALIKSAEFFDLSTMTSLSRALGAVANAVLTLSDAMIAQALPRLNAVIALLREQTDAVAAGECVNRSVGCLCEALLQIGLENGLDDRRTLAGGASPSDALVLDGVFPNPQSIPERISGGNSAIASAVLPAARSATIPEPQAATPPAAAIAGTSTSGTSQGVSAGSTEVHPASSAAATPATGATSAASAGVTTPAEQTIRVEVSRLESLLNLVGELVLQKNRLASISRGASSHNVGNQDFRDQFTLAAGSLDRVTSDIQVAVMRTRMQPLEKLFGKYPRLIRDLARKTGKDIQLVIQGGDTEVDKSVIEELGDPLIHIMRNSADHGIENPEQRRDAGKPPQGVITLAASHEGSHVLIRISDNGRGLSRSRIGNKAVERGIISEQELAKLSDRDVCQFIFAAGFSTAEKVTDLSGRGVGMDVVRTNIEKIKGTIDLSSVEGKGTTISIRIPLTVAIMTSMMVDVGTETYAIPLSSITEIVKPAPEAISSVQGHPVLRLRDSVLPLLDGCGIFDLPQSKRRPTPFAVIVSVGDRRVGLMVTRLIGQQEIVIKPLDGVVDQAGPVSGATVRDDGGVSLIVDVPEMVRLAESRIASPRVMTRNDRAASADYANAGAHAPISPRH